MPIMRLVSSNTNQLMPAAGATFARLGNIPCEAASIPQGTHDAARRVQTPSLQPVTFTLILVRLLRRRCLQCLTWQAAVNALYWVWELKKGESPYTDPSRPPSHLP